MGNYASCTFAAAGGRSSSSAKVIFPGGEVRRIDTPTKTAELMLEKPSFFLVNSQSLKIGRRFSPLAADEDLEMANSYVMFPMKRLNSVITASDMGVLFLAAKRVSGEKATINIIAEIPVGDLAVKEKVVSAVKTEVNGGDVEEIATPFLMHRLSMCRTRKPLLETIAEDQPAC